MSAVLLAVIALPLVAALAAMVVGPGMAGRIGAGAAGVSFGLVAWLTVEVVRHGPVSAVVSDPDGRILVGVSADRLGCALALLVCAVSAVVQVFARRYLAGDSRAVWFTASTGLLTASSVGLMFAATLVGLAIFWSAAGIALCLLLGTYRQLPSARAGVSRTARVFLIGDAALWAAVALATARWGNLDLRTLDRDTVTGSPVLLTAVACLIVVAALARSAQLPLQGWLPATLAAPTPVSALLHAGVVNAGGVLLVRLSPMTGASALAMAAAFAAGALTLVYGTVLMLTKPDIKGALAHSTMAQMGFMIMTCGLGLYAAAVFHLIAHGLYKATLFLSSGSAVARQLRHATAPPPAPVTGPRQVVLAGFALVASAGALLGATALLPLPPEEHASGVALLLFAGASATTAAFAWLCRHATIRGALAAAGVLGVAAVGYVGLVAMVTGFISPALPISDTLAGTPVLITTVAVVLAAVAGIRHWSVSGPAASIHKTIYALALSAGHVHAPPPRIGVQP